MRSRRDQRIRLFILVTGALIFLLFLFLDPIVRSSVKRDRMGARPQKGVATVVVLVPPISVDMDHPMHARVSVRFRGQIYSPKDILEFDRLSLNHPAQITYRVGKSGRIYVDEVEPLPSDTPNSAPH